MLDSQNRLQNYFKNAKTTKFFSELAFHTSKGHTCKVSSFYDFWFTFNDKFCSPYPIVGFYAYLITKIGNRNLKGPRDPGVKGLRIGFSFCCEHFGLCCELFAFAVNFLICAVNNLVCAVSYLLLL